MKTEDIFDSLTNNAIDFMTTSLNELKDDFDGFLIIALTGVMGVTERLGKMMKNLKAGGLETTEYLIHENFKWNLKTG